MADFIEDQRAKLRRRGRRRRRHLSDPPIDQRLWLDEHRFAAWTMTGDLVTIEEAKPGFGAMPIRLATRAEIRDLLAVNRLVSTVVSLYPGDELRAGNVTRFIADHRLEHALNAALRRAHAEEARVAHSEPPATRTADCEPQLDGPMVEAGSNPPAHRKTRFDPRGSCVVFRELPADLGQPDFVVDSLGGFVPSAFESRRKAERFIRKHETRGRLPEGCEVARVLACAMVRPIVRPGFRAARDIEVFLEQIRKEPRLILPNLRVRWLPRYEQDEDGVWRKQSFQFRRTVRHKLDRMLLDDLRSTSREAARIVEEEQVRRAVETQEVCAGAIDQALRRMRKLPWFDDRVVDELEQSRREDLENEKIIRDGRKLAARLQAHAQVASRAARRLPATWRSRIGLETAVVDWPTVHDRVGLAVEHEQGYWLRAPWEFGGGARRARRRIVELQIDDLASFLEEFGIETRWWLLMPRPGGVPRWVLPVATWDLGDD